MANKGLLHTEVPFEDIKKLHAYSNDNPKGLGTADVNNWLHLSLDIEDKEKNHAELYGDMSVFGSDHDFDVGKYPDLAVLNADQFDEIVLSNVADYIEWKNQEEFFSFIYSIMANQGVLTLDCRNFDEIFGKKGYIQENKLSILNALDSWEAVMRAIYSGCSPNDIFKSCHTRGSIKATLKRSGFRSIRIKTSGHHYHVSCRKIDLS